MLGVTACVHPFTNYPLERSKRVKVHAGIAKPLRITRQKKSADHFPPTG